MTNTASPRQIAYAIELRDNLRARLDAGTESQEWAWSNSQVIEQLVLTLVEAARRPAPSPTRAILDRSKPAPWWRPLVPTAEETADYDAIRARLTEVLIARREAIIAATDDEIAGMGKDISAYIDAAKAF